MKAHNTTEIPVENRLIVSIYDYSGAWPADYIKAGYPTILWDYKHEGCILQHFDRLVFKIDEAIEAGYVPYGLFAAPPCTDISAAGAQYWPAKDAENAPEGYECFSNRSEYAEALAAIVLVLRDLYDWNFWTLENPPGRLEKMVPELKPFRKMMFRPFEYGDDMTKRTILWGEFNADLVKTPIVPTTVTLSTNGRKFQTSEIWAKTGGKSNKTKTARSNTPKGFSKAFFAANQ
jgi:hypothetical protein